MGKSQLKMVRTGNPEDSYRRTEVRVTRLGMLKNPWADGLIRIQTGSFVPSPDFIGKRPTKNRVERTISFPFTPKEKNFSILIGRLGSLTGATDIEFMEGADTVKKLRMAAIAQLRKELVQLEEHYQIPENQPKILRSVNEGDSRYAPMFTILGSKASVIHSLVDVESPRIHPPTLHYAIVFPESFNTVSFAGATLMFGRTDEENRDLVCYSFNDSAGAYGLSNGSERSIIFGYQARVLVGPADGS